MSQRVFQVNAFTATATADHATTLANGTYLGIDSGGATQRCEVTEIYMGGHSAASNVNIMMFARHNTVAATLTALSAPNSDGPMDNTHSAHAAPSRGFVAATTVPTRSANVALARLSLSYNSFGGIVRWMQNKGYGWFITGNTADLSQSSLSAFTGGGGGVMSAHIIYEQV